VRGGEQEKRFLEKKEGPLGLEEKRAFFGGRTFIESDKKRLCGNATQEMGRERE